MAGSSAAWCGAASAAAHIALRASPHRPAARSAATSADSVCAWPGRAAEAAVSAEAAPAESPDALSATPHPSSARPRRTRASGDTASGASAAGVWRRGAATSGGEGGLWGRDVETVSAVARESSRLAPRRRRCRRSTFDGVTRRRRASPHLRPRACAPAAPAAPASPPRARQRKPRWAARINTRRRGGTAPPRGWARGATRARGELATRDRNTRRAALQRRERAAHRGW